MEYFKARTYQSSLEHYKWNLVGHLGILGLDMALFYACLCTCLTWSSSYWIIPMKQNFKHSLKNTVWQFKFCYFYFIVIIITIIIFFKSKKDKLYSLHYWIDWYGWSLLKDDKSSHEALVIQSNQRLTWICQISQHTAKKMTKWIIIIFFQHLTDRIFFSHSLWICHILILYNRFDKAKSSSSLYQSEDNATIIKAKIKGMFTT